MFYLLCRFKLKNMWWKRFNLHLAPLVSLSLHGGHQTSLIFEINREIVREQKLYEVGVVCHPTYEGRVWGTVCSALWGKLMFFGDRLSIFRKT